MVRAYPVAVEDFGLWVVGLWSFEFWGFTRFFFGFGGFKFKARICGFLGLVKGLQSLGF